MHEEYEEIKLLERLEYGKHIITELDDELITLVGESPRTFFQLEKNTYLRRFSSGHMSVVDKEESREISAPLHNRHQSFLDSIWSRALENKHEKIKT